MTDEKEFFRKRKNIQVSSMVNRSPGAGVIKVDGRVAESPFGNNSWNSFVSTIQLY